MIRYFSDPHLGHANIIRYCDRPFMTVEEQDATIWRALAEADAAGDTLICLGDWSFNRSTFVIPPFVYPERHTLLFGNHDKRSHGYYRKWFGQLLGAKKTWDTHYEIRVETGVRILLSHAPQQNLRGCDWNLHGHIHNAFTKGDYALPNWLLESKQHLNISVEMIEYRPRTFAELLEMRDANPRALR